MKEEKYIKRKINKILAREKRWDIFFNTCIKIGVVLWFMIWVAVIIVLLK